ncbi:SpaH/EbpB family LPXTG-anchored major pilin [Blautia ammoniilytica]|uniref:SpaH/EbpB family LPXTG-anchored major pilin n=1 Tax=Blautia ammoniilytica TaxID=2981782 RepID=A0ABT2TWJ9_9FIRM|nr:SpaH/EbpB family LPXTG-anchored major pilin [Blautia ammoniilytica]MCU6766610.1 SpaH/EbpB family LPXTG-anchored major pilin [Blautia ammoniilytica]SCI70427.1 Fimbrial subunit type 1 precursor [uncultured Blautia sp.]
MKKFKKLLAGLLTGAMLLGSMSVSSFAADTTASKTPVIDENERGSITIHKYTEGTATGTAASGKEDASQVPAGAVPIKDVGFTIYKVQDAAKLADYYSTTPASLPAATDYYTGTGKNVQVNADVAALKVGNEVPTNADGVAEFTNLDLGLYLVVETTSPAIVTGPCDPFLISVPMTTDGDDWLYNVHVYPKNSTAVGGVSLVKTGKAGAALKGVTFVLQKKNGDSWTDITKKSTALGDNTGTVLNLVTNEAGKISVEDLSSGTYRFIETSVGADNKGYIMDGAATYEFKVEGNDVTYAGNTGTNITIPVTNDKPDMTKEVKNGSEWKHDADYSVGDKVPYRITVSVPANIKKLKKFALTDTPTNLKDDANSVKVTDKTGSTTIPATATATEDGNGFTIDFTLADLDSYAGQNIIVTYNAELLDTAVTTTVGNPNTATLEYSNKILPDTDDGYNPNKPGTPTTDKITDTAVVYTFQIQIEKKAEKADGTPLADVEFDLYKAVDAGTAGVATADEVKKAGLDSSKAWKKINETSLKTNTEGKVSQSGLKNGEYYLVETKTNAEYNLLKAPVKVTLNIAYTTTTKAEYNIDETGKTTLVKHEVEKTEFKNNDVASDGIQIETVINKKGFELPLTGGMGTVLFSVIGLALVLAGVVVITASRKKTAK